MCSLAAAVEGVLWVNQRAKAGLLLLRWNLKLQVSFKSAFFVLTLPHSLLSHLSEITSRVWEEALRMGIFQRSASDCLPLHHDISIILIPCKWFGGFSTLQHVLLSLTAEQLQTQTLTWNVTLCGGLFLLRKSFGPVGFRFLSY